MNYKQRAEVIRNIKGVDKVIPQESLDYVPNLTKLKPDYLVHGDDWKHGVQSKIRERAIKTLSKWGGRVIEIPYTEGISSSLIQKSIQEMGITTNSRLEIYNFIFFFFIV